MELDFLTASRRARQALGVREGDKLDADLLESERALVVPYTVGNRQERLVYLSEAGDLAAYDLPTGPVVVCMFGLVLLVAFAVRRLMGSTVAVAERELPEQAVT